MIRWDDESNESMYGRCGMGSHTNGVNCGVVEWVKRNMLRWFGHMEMMRSEVFVKKVHVSESMDPNTRGRPPGRWRDRLKGYICERVATKVGELNQARRECWERERWRLFCLGHLLGGRSWRKQGVRAIDR